MSAEIASTSYLLDLDTPKKKLIFWGYISLWCLQALCIYGSSEDGKRAYNATVVVACTEAAKLILSTYLYLQYDHDWNKGLPEGWKKLFALYTIPAFLYCIYNNLTYVCLARIDPTTYYLFLQLRIMLTAVVWRILFQKEISSQQWKALTLITVGCVVKELGKNQGGGATSSEGEVEGEYSSWFINMILIGVQLFSSVGAGVYTEFLLKDYKAMSTSLQNIFMYINSIAANVVYLMLSKKEGGENDQANGMSLEAVIIVLTTPVTLFLVCNGASTGILTGFFLANLDSMRKTIAAALEIILIAVLSWFFFQTDLGPSTILSAVFVSYGVYLYSAKPAEKK